MILTDKDFIENQPRLPKEKLVNKMWLPDNRYLYIFTLCNGKT